MEPREQRRNYLKYARLSNGQQNNALTLCHSRADRIVHLEDGCLAQNDVLTVSDS